MQIGLFFYAHICDICTDGWVAYWGKKINHSSAVTAPFEKNLSATNGLSSQRDSYAKIRPFDNVEMYIDENIVWYSIGILLK